MCRNAELRFIGTTNQHLNNCRECRGSGDSISQQELVFECTWPEGKTACRENNAGQRFERIDIPLPCWAHQEQSIRAKFEAGHFRELAMGGFEEILQRFKENRRKVILHMLRTMKELEDVEYGRSISRLALS